MYGSGRLHPRAAQLGIRNTLVRLSRAGHVPFESNAAYADTTFRAMRDFLRPILSQPGTVITASTPGATKAVARAQAYPNPATNLVHVVLPEAWLTYADAQLIDAAGRLVRMVPGTRNLNLLRGSLKAGIYSLKFPGQAPVRIVFE